MRSKEMARVNLHLYQSSFTHETRILKITKSLAEAGVFDRILIMARWDIGLPRSESLDAVRQVRRTGAPLSTARGGGLWKLLGTFAWLAGAWFHAIRLPLACVNCHSVLVLPLGAVLKMLKGCKLIYDTHELETESASARGSRRAIVRFIERTCMRHVDAVFVVGDAIAGWYRKEYPFARVAAVKNVPYRAAPIVRRGRQLRERFAIADDELLFLYQGAMAEGRGIPLLLQVFSGLPRSRHVVFLGYGQLTDIVRQFAARCSNIHFHPAVPPEQLMELTAEADVGLSVIENLCLSYYYCLPNKVFEYLGAGVPPVVSDFPEMAKLVDGRQCGWKTPVDEDDVAKLLGRLTREEICEKRAAVLDCRSQFGWDQEERVLLGMYRRLRLAPTESSKAVRSCETDRPAASDQLRR